MRRLLAFLLLLLAAPVAAQEVPRFTGLVVDAANVLPPATEADLTAKLEALQKDTGRQLVVATLPDLGGRPLDDYGYRLGRAWGVGLKNADNGVLLLIAPNEPPGQRGPRIEVGEGLEPVLTDALSSRIINDDMMPHLKAGDVPGAMTAGTDALVAQLRATPDEAKGKTDAAIRDFDRRQPRQRERGGGFPVGLVFWLIVLFVVLGQLRRGRRKKGPWGVTRRRRRGDGWEVLLWTVANEVAREASRSRSRGGWSGGGGWSSGGGGRSSGGGGWTGGGFTGGGGGSFGGGGASGSW